MQVQSFYEPLTQTLTHLVYDEATKDAVLIDPVLEYDPASARTSTAFSEKIGAVITERGLHLHYSLETHPHADHMSGATWFKRRFSAKTAISEQVRIVQETFRPIFDLPSSFRTDGSQFDQLLADGEVLRAGSLKIRVIATPGHTPACVSYHIGDAVFVGDALFMEDYGTGRCDFPRGDAKALYHSVHDRLYALPPNTRVFPGHDYPPNGRAVRSETTIAKEIAENVQLKGDTTEEAYVAMRTARDKTLAAPRLLFPSIRINIDGGHLPAADGNGRRFLTLPLNPFRPSGDDGSVL
ncbi:MAG: MBL fold metallo-hydrolase [Myxococcota bacterium]